MNIIDLIVTKMFMKSSNIFFKHAKKIKTGERRS